MEPTLQAEIQLGHMCNNRCVFCVSGQRTAWGEAGPLEVEPVLLKLEEIYAAGSRKITLLGGEPTLQPGFKLVLERCRDLGFEEVVIFTNGAKTARASFVEELIALGTPLSWRISIQGATKEAHERTTLKKGSFDRILATLETLHRLGERISINMCVVESNYASVGAFPALIKRYGIEQLHLDMMRPRDAGVRSEEALRAMMPNYPLMRDALESLYRAVPVGFDLNLGNLPYCVAPTLAPIIHHDGERTYTVSVDEQDALSEAWDKYEDKRTDKVKLERCVDCCFDARCSGVFDRWLEFYGGAALQPVSLEQLRALDPSQENFWAYAWGLGRKLQRQLGTQGEAAPTMKIQEDNELQLQLAVAGEAPLRLSLRPAAEIGIAGLDGVSLHLEEGVVSAAATKTQRERLLERLRGLWTQCSEAGVASIHPPGEDLFGLADPAILSALWRLRAAAPFGGLRWETLEIDATGRRAELGLVHESTRLSFWIETGSGAPKAGYRLVEGGSSPALVSGLRALMSILASRGQAAAQGSGADLGLKRRVRP